MIQLVLNRLLYGLSSTWSIKVTLICQKTLMQEYGNKINAIPDHAAMKLFHPSLKQNLSVVTIDGYTEGAVVTALAAIDLIDANDELLITDCDHMIGDIGYMTGAIEKFRKQKAAAGLLCHVDDSPKWSFCQLSGQRVVNVVEKSVISHFANTGDYYYAKASSFFDAAKRMIEKNDRTKGEFYISPTMNYIIADGGLVLPYIVNNMIGLGTPEDLDRYNATR